MAEGVISLINDTDGRRLVSSFLSTQQGTAPPFVYGDKTPITVRLVTATTSGDSPWKEISLTGKTVRVGIGTPGKRPTSGTFTISYDGDTTSSLAYNASESAISIALNALPSITSAGGVVVTSSAPGLIKIIFNDDGERETFTINSNSLFPTSSGYAAQSIVGDVSTKEIVNIRLETDHVAYVELTDPLDSAAITVATVREGAADVSDIQTLIFDPLPYGGTYTLTIDGEETASLDYNASAASVKSALESLSLFQTGDVTVSGTFPEFTIAFDPSLGDVGDITGDASALVVPTGRKGTLSTATIGVSELLNGSYRADATLEIEVYTTATASSWTTLQAACVVKDDVIPNEPASPTDVPSCLTAESLTSGNIETALGYTPADAAATQSALAAFAEDVVNDLAAETAAREARDGGVASNARFVMDGDSITNPNLALYPTLTSWVPFFEDLPNCTGRGTVSNVAVSGSTYSSMIARYAANVYPLRPTSGEPVYLFTMIGSNDGGTASSTWISALEAYWTTAKADGFTIVAITPPVHDANSNTLRFASSVRTSTVPDYVVNLGEVFRSSNNTEMFLVDDLHPTEKGAKLIAQAVNNVLFNTSNNATNRPFTVGSTGLGVGTDDPRAAAHLIGVAQLRLGNNQSANTIKSFALALEPYGASSDTVFDFMGGASSSTYNNVYIGRGASANKAATQAQFWATTNATATASSAVMYGILASGKWTFGNLASSNNAAGLAIAINDSGNPGFSISRTAGANSRQSGVFGLPAANGSLVLNSLQDELVIAPQTGKSLAFATAVLPSTNYQTVRIRIKASGVVNFVTSPTTYADNAAAISGGLTTGDVYKTSTGQLMIVY